MAKAVFERFDLWVTKKDDKKELIKSFKSKDELMVYLKSRKFRKVLKDSVNVEVLQVFNKLSDDEANAKHAV